MQISSCVTDLITPPVSCQCNYHTNELIRFKRTVINIVIILIGAPANLKTKTKKESMYKIPDEKQVMK